VTATAARVRDALRLRLRGERANALEPATFI